MDSSRFSRLWLSLTVAIFAAVMIGVVKPTAHYIAVNGGWSGFIIAMGAIFAAAIYFDRA